MVRRFSTLLIKNRLLVLTIISLVTVLCALQTRKITVKTKFDDLLPQDHPYIRIHDKYEEQLGAPYKVFVLLQVKGGDVYNARTLKKAVDITDELDTIPGVNHNQVYSIASRKVKKITVTADGILTQNLMDHAPRTEAELASFKKSVRNSRSTYGVWVSSDEKSLLFSAAFIPHRVNIEVLFKRIRNLAEEFTDADHTIHVAGEPILTGWVHYYQEEMYWIFLATLSALFLLLYLYFRNLVGVIVPIISTLVGSIWGLGFWGALSFNIDPLTLVIPLLICARALSHSVQVTERYFECYCEHKDVQTACIECTSSILPPGILGIITDGFGILLIAVAPIPIMQKLAYGCAYWAFSIIFTGLILTPVLISFFKPPRNVSAIVDTEKGLTQKILEKIAWVGFGKTGVSVVVGLAAVAITTGYIASQVDIGDIHPGTPILWPDSDYNVAVSQINENFPGTEELYIIAEGRGKDSVEDPAFLFVLDSFQKHMAREPKVSAALSVVDFILPVSKSVYGGYFKWETIPTDKIRSGQLFYLLTANTAPGDYDLYFSRDKRNATIVIWFKDHMGDTIRQAVSAVRSFIEEKKDVLQQSGVSLQLASGNIGVLAAVNETVRNSQFLNFVLVMGVIFILCSFTYRSIVAAIILMIPLNVTNLITLSIMKALGIGLNINTLPIISVGVGVGIDYGIYLLSRISEEYQLNGEYSFVTARSAIQTTGKAIFFTATTMIGGVIFWYFLSSLRFQAEMGLLLAIIMFINMVGALLVIPSLVYVFKPKFLGRVKLLVKE